MLDPATIYDLHRAMIPPAIMPPAIERAWLSPEAEEGQRILKAAMDEQQAEGERWRANLDVWTGSFGRVGDVPRSVRELELLERLAHYTGRQTRLLRREAERARSRLARDQKLVKSADATAGRVFGDYVRRTLHMRAENADALARLSTAIQAYRERVDYRGRAKFNRDERDFLPNAETIAAMQEARAGVGMRRTASVADLMAELHAEDD